MATLTPSLQTEAAQPNNERRTRLLAILNKIEDLESRINKMEAQPELCPIKEASG